MAIRLPPSDDVNALANAIHEATTSGEPLVLLPGVHLTKPGHQLRTPMGPKGLVLSGKPRRSPLLPGTTVQRPEFSVGDNPQHLTDEHYGLYFIPSHPSDPEIASLPFRVHPPIPNVIDEPFEFAILQRGDVKIGGFDLDCNMGKQKLKPKKARTASCSDSQGLLMMSGKVRAICSDGFLLRSIRLPCATSTY